jgi:putative ABC transport system ATP-binding protein
MTTQILQCKDLSKSFLVDGMEVSILRHIDFAVREGETLLIMGRSGQGKSVLLSLLAGLDSPTTGEIIFEGNSFRSLSGEQSTHLRRTRIGIIFQNFNLVPSWTALENVEAALEGFSFSSRNKRSKAILLLERFGLRDRLHRFPTTLSMGEQQRVAIARTLIREPQLILGDEPTGELDEETAENILQNLLAYTTHHRTSMLITSHGHFPKQYADRVLHLKDGTLQEITSPFVKTS